MAKNALPLVVSGLLQHSIAMTTVFQVGHLGQKELGAGTWTAQSDRRTLA
jgi:Na+-driven multidrug efflux pump